eukprot:865947-Pleurochrysis_carterae.AAC.2
MYVGVSRADDETARAPSEACLVITEARTYVDEALRGADGTTRQGSLRPPSPAWAALLVA